MSEDYKKEIDRLIKAAGVKAVNRISEPIRVEDAFQPKRRKTLKETIKVIADTPEEAQAFMALLQNAGIEQEMPQGDEMEPSDELPQPQGDELPQDGGPPCGMEAEAEGEIAQGADYANSPDEEYEDDPMNTYSTKWNHQKKFRRTNNHGDNPLSLADSLMREWTDVRDTKETEEVIDPRIKERQVGEAIGGEWSRNTPPALMAVIKKHNIDPYDAKQMANEDFLGEVDMAADYHGAYLDRIAKEGKIKPDENGQFFFSDEEEELHDIDGGEMWHDSPEGEKFFGIIDELCQAMGINQEYKIQVEECGNALMKYVEDSATEERQVGEEELKRYGNYRRRN